MCMRCTAVKYGNELGPVPIPLTEEAPRAKNRNFYFEQEDFLRN